MLDLNNVPDQVEPTPPTTFPGTTRAQYVPPHGPLSRTARGWPARRLWNACGASGVAGQRMQLQVALPKTTTYSLRLHAPVLPRFLSLFTYYTSLMLCFPKIYWIEAPNPNLPSLASSSPSTHRHGSLDLAGAELRHTERIGARVCPWPAMTRTVVLAGELMT